MFLCHWMHACTVTSDVKFHEIFGVTYFWKFLKYFQNFTMFFSGSTLTRLTFFNIFNIPTSPFPFFSFSKPSYLMHSHQKRLRHCYPSEITHWDREVNTAVCSPFIGLGIFRSAAEALRCQIELIRWVDGWLVDWLDGWVSWWLSVTLFRQTIS